MKKISSLIIPVVVLFSTIAVSCDKDEDPVIQGTEVTQITINTSGNYTFVLCGTGTATVDWGDGSSNDTKQLAADIETGTVFHHTYSSIESTYVIKIYGKNITRLNCSGYGLINLDVSKNIALTNLDCCCGRLTTLDVSNNTALTYLSCGGSEITELDLSKNTALKFLDCGGSPMKNLDVSKNTALIELTCYGNELTSLDVSKNTALQKLFCNFNSLTGLDVSKNTALKAFTVENNLFTAEALNNLFEKLHSNAIPSENVIAIGGNNGTNGCNRSIAENKGWTVTEMR